MSSENSLKLLWIWIKKLFERCPKKKIAKKQTDLFIVCGHRGSPTKEIENTIPSFDLAIKEGANSIETDLCITKDKIVVLWHDWNPNDTVALLREKELEPDVKYKPLFPDHFSDYRKEISKLTLSEFLQNYHYIEKESSIPENIEISTLKDFFEWAVKKEELQQIFFDLKVPSSNTELSIDLMQEVKKLADQFKPKFKIIIETYSTKILLPLKEKFPGFSYSLDVELPPGIVLLPRKYSGVKKALKYLNDIAIILRPRFTTIANWVTFRRLINFEVKKQRRCNRKYPDKQIKYIVGGTINRESEIDCLIKLGIDGIQTDYPARLYALVKQYNLKS